MSLKNKHLQEVTLNLAHLRKVDFKSGQSFHSKGFLSFQDVPRLALEIQHKDPHFDILQKGLDWEVRTWIDEQADKTHEQRLSVHIKLSYPLECQRCLSLYEEAIDFSSQFLFKDTEDEVDNFPLENDHEDAILNSHQFDLIELFEDEVLLSLPLIPKHAIELCHPEVILVTGLGSPDDGFAQGADDSTSAKNPFLSLKKLKFDA